MAGASVPSSAESVDKLAASMHKWAVEEMHYQPRGRHASATIPSVDDFKPLCRGRMVDVWNHLITRVQSAETVKKIRGNLALKAHQRAPTYQVSHQGGSHYSEEEQELKARHAELSSQLTKTLNDVSHLQRDLSRLQKDILSTEKEYHDTCVRVGNIRRSTALITMYSHQVQEEAHQYEEYTSQMRLKADTIRQLSTRSNQDEQMYSKQTENDGNKDILETACSKHVRETCEVIGDFLHQLLEGSFASDKTLMAKKKDELWRHVEQLMGQHSPQQVVHALSLYAEHTALLLRNKAAAVDIRKDAEKLRFKYEKGGELSDLSNPPSILQSVHQLLQESQATHVERAIDVERSMNNAWRLQQRLAQALELAHATLRKQYGADPGALHMAKTLLQTEISAASDRACLHVLTNMSEDLKEGISTAMQEKEALYRKYRSIQDFKKVADSKQNLIRVLVKQNVHAPAQLAEQQKEIVQYIESNLGSHEVDAAEPAEKLQQGATEEVELFTSLSLPHLMFALLDSAYKIAVIDLSINRLNGTTQTTSGQMIAKILEQLEFPTFKGSECLLPHVMQLQQQVSEIEATLMTHSNMSRQVMEGHTGHRSSTQHIADLCEAVAQHDREQMERVLPMLQQRLSQAIKALTDCLAVKDTMQDWWEQPAQLTVPWITVDDLNLQQWHDKWTVAVTRLRQLQLKAK